MLRTEICSVNPNIWVLSAPDGPHVGPMNLAIRVIIKDIVCSAQDKCWMVVTHLNTLILGMSGWDLKNAIFNIVSLAGICRSSGHWFNIEISSYQYRKPHCGDKTVIRSSYLHNGISYTDIMASLYWIGPPDDNASRWMPLNLTVDQTAFVQVMAWCWQTKSHWLCQHTDPILCQHMAPRGHKRHPKFKIKLLDIYYEYCAEDYHEMYLCYISD